MGQSRIFKAKLLSNDEKLIIFHRRTNDDGSHSILPGEERDYAPHQELIDAFQALRMHLAMQYGYCTVKNARNPAILKPIHVTGFSIFGKNENGIIINGYRITESGSTAPMQTPKIWFESENSNYYFLAGLKEELSTLLRLLQNYLDGTQKGESRSSSPDGDNDFDADLDDDVDVDSDLEEEENDIPAPKKKAAKKAAKKKASKK